MNPQDLGISHAAHTLLVLGLLAPFAVLALLVLGLIISIAWEGK